MVKKLNYALLVLLLAFTGLFAENHEQKINKSFKLPAGGSMELANINGTIDITSSGGETVEIKAIKKSDHKGEIENVEVVFDQTGDALRVKVKYNKRNAKAKVDFVVSLPEKLARAEFKSVNGTLDCSGKFSDLKLKTVNGRIDFDGEFRAGSFKTVNGAIALSQEPLLSGDLDVETVNGAITIELNRKSAFWVEGRTINGSIDNEFGIKVEKHLVGSSFSGKVNDGGKYKVNVETVNGSIDISKI
ncbi:MAG: DUF4097 family beta strand repeat-containing protein [Acidobacteriota bacterium]|nr:DUF4097 family beta strand repeat-containing protein [Acidobacteriota bacterium]